MIFTKLHLGVALFASAYLYYSNPTTSSTTNYLPISEIQQNTKKSMDDGKEVYAIFAYNAIKQTEKGMAFSHLDGSMAYRKRTQSIHALKFD
jgi:hypothetical protein